MVVRRDVIATLLGQAAALAREGYFVESESLMTAAKTLMKVVTPEAGIVDHEAARRANES